MLELERRSKLTIDRLRTVLRARYCLLKGGKSSKSFGIAFLDSGTKRGISGHHRIKSVNLSGNTKKDGGAMGEDSNGQGSSSAVGGSNEAPSEKQGGPTRCNICKETGHKGFKCIKRVCSVPRDWPHPNSFPQVVKEDGQKIVTYCSQELSWTACASISNQSTS